MGELLSLSRDDHPGFNPELGPAVRWINIVVLVVVLVGSLLLVAPDLIVRYWPWVLPPFNARFLGGIYLAEATSLIILVGNNTWSPVRLAFIIAICFTVLATVGSLIHLDQFVPSWKRMTLWLVLYGGYIVLPAVVLWHHRYLPPFPAMPMPAALRTVALWLGGLVALYAIALFAAPQWVASFWPWTVDALHGRIYSGMFLAEGVGLMLAARGGARREIQLVGAATSVHGLAAIAGLYIAAASTGRELVYSAGTLAWLLAFTLLAANGIALLAATRR